MKRIKEKMSKNKWLSAVLILFLTAAYLFATASFAQSALPVEGGFFWQGTVNQLPPDPLSYGDFWSLEGVFGNTYYAALNTSTDTYHTSAEPDDDSTPPDGTVKTLSNKYYGYVKIQDHFGPTTTSVPLVTHSASDFWNYETVDGGVSGYQGQTIPLLNIKEGNTKARYSVVPNWTSSEGTVTYRVYVWYDGTEETGPNGHMSYTIVDNYAKSNSVTASSINGSSLTFYRADDNDEENKWWYAELSVDTTKVSSSWTAYSVSVKKEVQQSKATISDSNCVERGSLISTSAANMLLGGGEDNNNPYYYYNTWTVSNIYLHTMFVFEWDATSVQLGPITKADTLTIKQDSVDDACSGTLKVTNIFGEVIFDGSTSEASRTSAVALTAAHAPLVIEPTADAGSMFDGFNEWDVILGQSSYPFTYETTATITGKWLQEGTFPSISAGSNGQGAGGVIDFSYARTTYSFRTGIAQTYTVRADFTNATITSVGCTIKDPGKADKTVTLTPENPTVDIPVNMDTVEVVLTTGGKTSTLVLDSVGSGNPVAKIGNVDYYFIEDAILAAKSGDQIILIADTAFRTKEQGRKKAWEVDNAGYTIDAEVKLLIPCKEGDTGVFGTMPASKYAMNDSVKDDGTVTEATAPFAFRILTVPADVSIICNGEINVNGHRTETGQGTYGPGAPRGGHGKLVLSGSGTQLTVNGSVYCYGFVVGSGTVEVTSTGKVHEFFQIYDWPGGTNLAGSGNGGWKSKAEETTLFFSTEYFIQNVEAPLKVHSGGKVYMEAVLTAGGQTKTASSELVGSSGLFQLGSGTYITREYNSTTDRVTYSTGGTGTINLGQIEVSAKVMVVFNVTVKSSSYTLGINNALSLHVGSGTTFNMSNRFALLPGSELIVDEGGRLNLSEPLFIIGKDDWTSKMSFGSSLAPRYTVGRGSTKKMQVNSSGRLEVNGTLNISGDGGVYATGDATKNTDKIIYGTGTIIHGGTQLAGVLEGGYNETLHSFTVNNAFIVHKGESGLKNIKQYTYYGLGSEWFTHIAEYSENNTHKETKYYVGADFPDPDYTHETGNALTAYAHGAWAVTEKAGYTVKYNRTCGEEYLVVFSDANNTEGVGLAYRINDYVWLNATCYLGRTLTAAEQKNLSAEGFLLAFGSNGEVYVIKQIPATEFTGELTLQLKYGEFVSREFNVDLKTYQGTLSADSKDYALISAMLTYGEAAEDKFGSDEEVGGNDNGVPAPVVTKPDTSTAHTDTKLDRENVIITQGVKAYGYGVNLNFDNCIRFMYGLKLDGMTEEQWANVVQIGLIRSVQTENELVTNGSAAYVLYHNTGLSQNSTNLPSVGLTSNGTDATLSLNDVKAMWNNGEGILEIAYDLQYSDYNTIYTYRPYVMFMVNNELIASYGEQFDYGLETYLANRIKVETDSTENNLLYATWNYKEAVKTWLAK